MMKMALFAVAFMVAAFFGVQAADPELITDFAANSSKIDASFFTFTGFRSNVTAEAGKFLVKKASAVEFPGLFGLGVSMAKLSFMPTSINVPHLHPRGSELLFVQEGWLTVGLVDSTNKLFVQKLQAGDMFVFPKGLLHFQVNEGQYEVKAISAFSSVNAGTISIPTNLFGSNIADSVLSKAFKVPENIIESIKAAVAAK